ncbi:hypothetical protein PAUR_b0618 [Pseudoalteromonas aurantia 208]|uniref:Uncharacterized protein n=1 Tax=Pseudoalteromonas aurantia 208 TaxID=1314867 RepID=A0ABR9EHU9_9GAMM|nr:hypothetical protein [Pseudoalteromonas aurantia 208]
MSDASRAAFIFSQADCKQSTKNAHGVYQQALDILKSLNICKFIAR